MIVYESMLPSSFHLLAVRVTVGGSPQNARPDKCATKLMEAAYYVVL